MRGELIGINAAILQEAQGIGFAIPIKEVRAALDDILAPETASRWFGARVSQEGPLAVTSVDARSPAGKAGLKTGDTILEVNGKKPADFMEFNRLAARGAGPGFHPGLPAGGRSRRGPRPFAALPRVFQAAPGRRISGI